MLRRLLASAIACAVFGAVSLSAIAAPSESSQPESSQSAESSPEIKYIFSEISEKMMSYEIYEEIIANQIVFYSNVANGSLTNKPVTLDFPETVMVSMEKDKESLDYVSGKEISAPGRYVLTLKVNGADLLGGSEGDIYYGLFSFWIVKEESKPENNTGNSGNSNVSTEPVVPDTPDTPDIPDTPDTPDTPDIPENTDPIDIPGIEDNPVNTENPPEDPGEEAYDGETEIPYAPEDAALLRQYAATTRIRVRTDRGVEFYTNIPAGMRTTNDVDFTFIDSVTYKLLKNGEEVQYRAGAKIQDKGVYTLQVFDGGPDNPATFGFTIIGSAVNSISQYSVPDGCKIQSGAFNGIDIRTPENNIELGAEGKYSFRVACGNYTFDESFTLDNVPPDFLAVGVDENGEAHKGKVTLELVSEDIDYYTVMLNGEMLSKKSVELTEPGVYTITVYDKAGNFSVKTFELFYRMDGMAVITIVLLAAVVIAGIVFFIMTRKKFIVR